MFLSWAFRFLGAAAMKVNGQSWHFRSQRPTWATSRRCHDLINKLCATWSRGASTGTNSSTLLAWWELGLKTIGMKRIWLRPPSCQGRRRMNSGPINHPQPFIFPLLGAPPMRDTSATRSLSGACMTGILLRGQWSWLDTEETALEETAEGEVELGARG